MLAVDGDGFITPRKLARVGRECSVTVGVVSAYAPLAELPENWEEEEEMEEEEEEIEEAVEAK